MTIETSASELTVQLHGGRWAWVNGFENPDLPNNPESRADWIAGYLKQPDGIYVVNRAGDVWKVDSPSRLEDSWTQGELAKENGVLVGNNANLGSIRVPDESWGYLLNQLTYTPVLA